MAANKDFFTDLAQLGKLNQTVLKMFARNRDIDQETKSEVKDPQQPSHNTDPGEDAAPKAIDTPQPEA